jgi:cobalamin biosynthesis protein CobT
MSDGMAQMHERRQEPVPNTNRWFAPAPVARCRGLVRSVASRRSCHNGRSPTTSSAITPADRSVISGC